MLARLCEKMASWMGSRSTSSSLCTSLRSSILTSRLPVTCSEQAEGHRAKQNQRMQLEAGAGTVIAC